MKTQTNPFELSASAGEARISRRRALAGIATLTTGCVSLSLSGRLNAEEQIAQLNLVDPWLTIGQVQQHLLPNDGNGPDAKKVHAQAYLLAVTQQPQMDISSKDFLFNGVGWLNDLARQEKKAVFVLLDESQQNTLLEHIARSRVGENWLSMLMTYLIEALLTDPVYGGNPEGIGWSWLQYQAGFPRPSANKKWFLL